jgi:hypothetical protein
MGPPSGAVQYLAIRSGKAAGGVVHAKEESDET